MSAHGVLIAAIEAVLGAHPALGIAINGVFDARPLRAVRPYAVIEDPILMDWSTKDMIGREGRLTIALLEAGEDRARLRLLADLAAGALEAMPRDLGEGWRIASLVFVRSRVVPEGNGLCAAIVEFRVRMLQAN